MTTQNVKYVNIDKLMKDSRKPTALSANSILMFMPFTACEIRSKKTQQLVRKQPKFPPCNNNRIINTKPPTHLQEKETRTRTRTTEFSGFR